MVRKVNYTEAEKLAKKMGKNVEDVLDSYAKMKIILVDNSKEAGYQAMIGDIQGKLNEKTSAIAEYEGQLKEKDASITALGEEAKKAKEDYDSKINKQAEEIEAISKQLEDNGKMVDVLHKQVGDLNKDLGEKTEQLQRMEEDAKSNKGYMDNIESMVTTFLNVPMEKLHKLDEELNEKKEEPKVEEPAEAPVATAYAADPAQSLPEKPGAVSAQLPDYQKVTEAGETSDEKFGDDMTAEELEKRYGNVIPLGKFEDAVRDLGYEKEGVVKDGVFYTDNGNVAISVEEEVEGRTKRKKEDERNSVQKYMNMGEAIAATKSGRKVEKGFIVAFKQDWRQKIHGIEPIKLEGIIPDDVFKLFEKYGDQIAANNVLDADKAVLVPVTDKDGSHYRGFIKKLGYKETENGWEKRKPKKESELYDKFEYVVYLEGHDEIVDSEVFKQRGEFKDGYYGTHNLKLHNNIVKTIKQKTDAQNAIEMAKIENNPEILKAADAQITPKAMDVPQTPKIEPVEETVSEDDFAAKFENSKVKTND